MEIDYFSNSLYLPRYIYIFILVMYIIVYTCFLGLYKIHCQNTPHAILHCHALFAPADSRLVVSCWRLEAGRSHRMKREMNVNPAGKKKSPQNGSMGRRLVYLPT